MPTFQQLITAEFDIAAMKDLFFRIYTHPYVDGIIQKAVNFIHSMSPIVWAVILGLIALIFSNFGKKLLAVPLVIGCSAVGFLGGALYIAPRLASFVDKFDFLKSFITIDSVVVGIIFAAIGAILFLPIYFVGYAGVVGYLTYLFVYPLCNSFFGNTTAMVIGLGIAVGAVAAAFLFRRWVEMAVTAVVGAYLFMWAVHTVLPLHQIINYIIWVVFAIEGIVVQVKTRRRY